MKAIALFAFILAVTLTACISSPSGPALSKSRGVVLSYPPDQVWEQTKVTFSSIGRITRIDEGGMEVDVATGPDTSVAAVIEPYDKTRARTIVRISAHQGEREIPAVASRVLSQIQEQLLLFRAR